MKQIDISDEPIDDAYRDPSGLPVGVEGTVFGNDSERAETIAAYSNGWISPLKAAFALLGAALVSCFGGKRARAR